MFSMFGGGPPQTFQQYFRCYPVVMMSGKEREGLNYGGKIVMPPSALNRLTMLHISYPMLFSLQSEETKVKTHAGVLEFIAEEGRVYLPQWMMETLAVQPGSMIKICSVELPLGSFVKLQPQSVDFLDIYDPKAVLENALRNFTTLSVDDMVQISYNNRIYTIRVLEVKPESVHQSICVVETDLEVDFAPPVGYEESLERQKQEQLQKQQQQQQLPSGYSSRTATPGGTTMAEAINYAKVIKSTAAAKESQKSKYEGEGQKLSGRPIKSGAATDSNSNGTATPSAVTANEITSEELSVDAPPLNLPPGQLFFGYPIIPVRHPKEEEEREDMDSKGTSVHFKGTGKSLRGSRKRKAEQPSSAEIIEID